MGHRLGIAGEPNTGKSYSRKFLKDPNNTVIISPSRKMLHLYPEVDGKPTAAKPLTFKIKAGEKVFTFEEMKKTQSEMAILKSILKNPPADIEFTGNFVVVKSLAELAMWSHVVDKLIPRIHTLITPDFTHHISNITSSAAFRSRNSGGEAFTRFWDLAADALDSYFTNIDFYREDLIVVSEFHVEFNEVSRAYKIFVPAGKMLAEKCLPDSYYDVLLYTKVLDVDESPTRAGRYKLVTKKVDKFNARDAELFEEEYIPNDLQTVLDRYRAVNGIELS